MCVCVRVCVCVSGWVGVCGCGCGCGCVCVCECMCVHTCTRTLSFSVYIVDDKLTNQTPRRAAMHNDQPSLGVMQDSAAWFGSGSDTCIRMV